MALNRLQAARLLSAKELVLFEDSLADKVGNLGDKALTARIRQVRTQRDKFQDLLRRQKLATRQTTGTKLGPRGVSNARTEQKAQVFSEALLRLEKQQQRRERERARAMRSALAVQPAGARRPESPLAGHGTPQRSSKAPAKAPSTAPGKGSAASMARQADPSVAVTRQREAAGQMRVLAHVSSQGRRQQARRDSR